MLQMSYQWIIPGRVIYVLFTGEAPIDEVQRSIDIFITEFNLYGQERVHSIFDNTGATLLYSAFQGRKVVAPLADHPKSGWFIQINQSLPIVTNIVTNTIFQLSKARFRNVKTLAEAIEFLNDVDSAIPDLSSADFSLPPVKSVWDLLIPQAVPQGEQ